jgi:2-iminoacetate synthase
VSFVAEFNALPLEALVRQSLHTPVEAARASLASQRPTLEDFGRLISPAATELIEPLCRRSQQLTLQRFGKVMRLFAPLYLSNECINNCAYCGFSRDNPILRVTLSVEEVRREAAALKTEGFRNLLLVAGEHPKFVSSGYLRDCLNALHDDWPSLSLEVGPMETGDYRPLVGAGADGLVVYQETYDRAVYGRMHTAGPKRNFDWRLETPERAYAAGFRRLALRGVVRRRARGLPAAPLLEGVLHHLTTPLAALRRRVPAADADDRPRDGATGVRLPPDVSRCGTGPVHPRTGPVARRVDPVGHHLDERGQPH